MGSGSTPTSSRHNSISGYAHHPADPLPSFTKLSRKPSGASDTAVSGTGGSSTRRGKPTPIEQRAPFHISARCNIFSLSLSERTILLEGNFNATRYFERLSANIAECLKSLFILFAGLFLKHAASLLSTNNTFVSDAVHELTLPEESNRVELVEAILLTLHRVFSYDGHNFVSQERFEILAQPIVDQIENTMGTKEEYESRASRLIVPCIVSFASAIPDDSLHKQLVYQTLLKTRHAKSYVRSTALNALVEIARKLGEDFMSLLPENVPFLAELLEDEDEATEKCAQNAVLCTKSGRLTELYSSINSPKMQLEDAFRM